MFASAIRILKHREKAEDVVQESFIKAFEKIHVLTEDANLGAWLKRIVVNSSLDLLRNNTKITYTDDSYLLENTAEEKDEIDPIISIDFVKDCINKLKEKYRVILVLYMIEDYNHREIGELLQLKESTVRNQYKRGKDQLLKLIKNKNTCN